MDAPPEHPGKILPPRESPFFLSIGIAFGGEILATPPSTGKDPQVHISRDTRKVSLNLLDQPQAFGSEGKGSSLKSNVRSK